jgi:hypothetical protein
MKRTLVDQIVSNVLQEMRARGLARPNRTGDDSRPLTEVAPQSTLHLNSPVITEEVLQTANAAGRKVAFPISAVITPSGREFIRQHRVTITTAAPDDGQPQAGMMVINGDVVAAITAAESSHWSVELQQSDHAVAESAQTHALQSVVACCCAEPSLVACLINRNADLRAAVLDTQTEIAALISAMQPHVFCFRNSGWSLLQLRKLLRHATAHAAPRSRPDATVLTGASS